jgi:hypothetical protein
MIDGERNLREIASILGVSEFEVARTVYGMTCTGLIVAAAPAEAMANG